MGSAQRSLSPTRFDKSLGDPLSQVSGQKLSLCARDYRCVTVSVR